MCYDYYQHHHHHHGCNCDCDWIFFMCCWNAVVFLVGFKFMWYSVFILSPLPILCGFYVFFMLAFIPSCISSIFGMMGYYYYTRRLLLFHLGFSLSSVLIGVLALVLAFVVCNPVETSRKNFWRFAVWHGSTNNPNYDWYDELDNPFYEFTNDIPHFQYTYHCCGFYGAQDYMSNFTSVYENQKPFIELVPPLSCCPLISPGSVAEYEDIKAEIAQAGFGVTRDGEDAATTVVSRSPYGMSANESANAVNGDSLSSEGIDSHSGTLLAKYDQCYPVYGKPLYYPTPCGDIIKYFYNYWLWLSFYGPFIAYLLMELLLLLIGVCLLPNRYDLYPPPCYPAPGQYEPRGSAYGSSVANCYLPTNPAFPNFRANGQMRPTVAPMSAPVAQSVV